MLKHACHTVSRLPVLDLIATVFFKLVSFIFLLCHAVQQMCSVSRLEKCDAFSFSMCKYRKA